MTSEAILKAAVRFSEARSRVQNENFRATLQRAICKIPPKDEATAPEGGGRKVSTAAAADRPRNSWLGLRKIGLWPYEKLAAQQFPVMRLKPSAQSRLFAASETAIRGGVYGANRPFSDQRRARETARIR
jgi:hypothetical protein